MAITGSGSLAISLSVFVISAAFLPKGEFPFLCVSRTGVWLPCGIAPSSAEAGRETMSGEKLWCVCAPGCAQASPRIAASLSPRRCGLYEMLLFSTLLFRGVVLSYRVSDSGGEKK